MVGIGDQRIAVAIGEPRRLDQQMQPLGLEGRQPGEVEAGEDVKHQQRRQPLVVGRHLIDIDAAIAALDRLDIGAL